MKNIYEERAKDIFTSPAGRVALGHYNPEHQNYAFGKIPPSSHEGQMLPPTMAPLLIREAAQPAAASGSTLYIHIPFCNLHCTYCGFYKNSVQEQLVESYTQSLLQEIEFLEQQGVWQKRKFAALFFGGGTPSTLTPSQITRILTSLQQKISLTTNAEITFESSIYDMSHEKFAACIHGGINRFSFGIQTFNTDRRRSLGRPDPQAKLVEHLRSFAQADARIIIDLIYGLPGQTEAELLEDLRLALDCNIAGLDLYKLQILPQSPLAEAIKKEKVIYDDSDQRLLALFRASSNYLTQAGAQQLSCCHWATKPEEMSLYNTLVKRGADIIALGSGCGGRLGRYQFMKQPQTQAYMEQVKKQSYPLMFLSRQNPVYLFLKGLSGQIDSGYLELSRLAQFSPLPWSHLLRPLLDTWQQEGLLGFPQEGRYPFTTLGQYWCKQMNRVALFFVEYILYGASTPQEKSAPPAAMTAMKNLR